jgi:aminopeptidase
MAVGWAYNYPTYNGKPINVDNGNRSKIHWDITTLLRGQNSEIIVDDKVLQKNGLWLDPRLTVLNEWRGAIEKEKQPIWRQKKHPAKHKWSQE